MDTGSSVMLLGTEQLALGALLKHRTNLQTALSQVVKTVTT